MRLLVTDLDNTLYDWVTFFARSFSAMVAELVTFLGIEEEVLLDEFKAVHQKYGSSEQPFTALELPSVKARFGHLSRRERMEKLAQPFSAFNAARRRHLRLYGGVAETLHALKKKGFLIVGHTEAIAAVAVYRLRKLGIIDLFTHLYVLASEYEGHPDPDREVELAPPLDFVRTLPRSERKPNPGLLRDICAREGVAVGDVWYVGDSLTRDVSMARAAGVTAVWARYGTRYERDHWQILVRVTHWTEQDVRREEELRERLKEVVPDFTIDQFGELLSLPGIREIEGDDTRAETAGRALAGMHALRR